MTSMGTAAAVAPCIRAAPKGSGSHLYCPSPMTHQDTSRDQHGHRGGCCTLHEGGPSGSQGDGDLHAQRQEQQQPAHTGRETG